MYIDYALMFSQDQAVTVTAVSTKAVQVNVNVGAGTPVFPTVTITTPFAGLTSLAFELQTSDTEAGAYTTIATTEPVLLAGLNANEFFANFGSVPPVTKAWIKMKYVVVGTATAGKVTSSITLDRQTNSVI